MTATSKYRAHRVIREDRADGTILLSSGYELSTPAETSRDWLHHWAEVRRGTVFLAERSGAGWRELAYGVALEQVRALAGALLDRGMGPDTPILILSGNGVDHGLLTLAAHYVGIPTVPVAEQYSLIPGAEVQLKYIAGLIEPRMVFAADGAAFGRALALEEFATVEKLVSENADPGQTQFKTLLKGDAGDVDAVAASVGPDSVVKILMTSGSTGNPKGVETTHRMMCTNQAQIADALPFLKSRPPRIVDWLPWNHVFGGSHNFNMMLANGGSLYVDGGKPAKGLIDRTIENNRLISATMTFNVPVGYAMLRDALRGDAGLRRAYFEELDMLFYAGASLPQDVWRDLEDMAREVRGDVPLMTSSWGLTETAPGAMIQHEPTDRSGIVGAPMTGLQVKLVPDEDDRFEVRIKGPSIFQHYFRDPAKTREAFDDEGYFLTGDAMSFVEAKDPNKGLKFENRLSEDFKLGSGIRVRAAELRLSALAALAPLAGDVVVTGEGREEVGLLIFPAADLAATLQADGGALRGPKAQADLTARLAAFADTAQGSSQRVARALILADPPSVARGEITAKGNLNFRRVLRERADMLARLYDDADAAVIRV